MAVGENFNTLLNNERLLNCFTNLQTLVVRSRYSSL